MIIQNSMAGSNPDSHAVFPPALNDPAPHGFRLASLTDLEELESGVYWPRLQPHFLNPHFRRLVYRINEAVPKDAGPGEVMSTRGASGFGELDVAYIADRCKTEMIITDIGLPDYCLTIVSRGRLICSGTHASGQCEVTKQVGLIYRGLPGTSLAASGEHERLAIWVPTASLHRRLTSLLGAPGKEEVLFEPIINLTTKAGTHIGRLVQLLIDDANNSSMMARLDQARQSFIDLLLYSMLEGLPNNYSQQLACEAHQVVPGTIRRAEEYIRANATQPMALDDIAAAAGCSVRSLQLGFRQFRNTTPAVALLSARLEAVRRDIISQPFLGNVTDLAYAYGFSNPGRFSKLYKQAFGVSPVHAVGLGRPRIQQQQ